MLAYTVAQQSDT